MSTEVAQEQPQEQAPPPEESAQEQPQEQAAASLDVGDDAAVDAALEQAAIKLPDGDALTPMSEVGKVAQAYRKEIKGLKSQLEQANTSAQRTAQLEQQLAQMQAQLQALTPQAQAYAAMQQAASQQPPAEDDSEAEEYARLLDLYTPEGKPDISRAKKAIALHDKRAGKLAQEQVQPLQQSAVSQQSAFNKARAKNTILPNGVKADPAMIDLVWGRLDPELTATPEGAKHAYMVALGFSQATGQQAAGQAPQRQRGPDGKFVQPGQPAEPLGEPLFTEKAGGKNTPNASPLDDKDRAYIKDMGMTEKEFLDAANRAPWLRRG